MPTYIQTGIASITYCKIQADTVGKVQNRNPFLNTERLTIMRVTLFADESVTLRRIFTNEHSSQPCNPSPVTGSISRGSHIHTLLVPHLGSIHASRHIIILLREPLQRGGLSSILTASLLRPSPVPETHGIGCSSWRRGLCPSWGRGLVRVHALGG